jgi:ABC-2 type transport system ATP-binding protein
MIEVRNLRKIYKKEKKYAVDDISFEVDKGQLFAFLGPNGAGKTTTISILTTTLFKSEGTINIAGFDLDKNSKDVRKNIGIIFQNPSLDLNLSAEENIRLHAALYGLYGFRPIYSMMPKEYKDRVNYLAEIIGIKDELFKEVKSFSGGMKRKLEIVRSLIHKPKVLFLDEPSTGLDPFSRNELWKYLRTVRQEENTTVFLTTHYLEEAEEADKVCIINNGKIIKNNTPLEIKKELIQDVLFLDTTDSSSLQKELISKNISFTTNGKFAIKIENRASLQELIKSISTPLIDIEIAKPSLEEAYINLIGKEKVN